MGTIDGVKLIVWETKGLVHVIPAAGSVTLTTLRSYGNRGFSIGGYARQTKLALELNRAPVSEPITETSVLKSLYRILLLGLAWVAPVRLFESMLVMVMLY